MTCCVFGCQVGSKSYKGTKYTLYGFRTSPGLRKQWLEQVNRANFTPTKSTVICGRHFADDQFKPFVPRSRGRKRLTRELKPLAIPTLFLKPSATCDEEIAQTSSAPQQCTTAPTTSGEHSYAGGNVSGVKQAPLDTMIQNEVTISESESDIPIESAKPKSPPITFCGDCIEQREIHEALLDRIRVLEEENKALKLVQECLGKIFNPDQVTKMLSPSSSSMHWSTLTIMQSVYLYYKMGTTAYEYLRKARNHPLPSLTTLHRHLREVKCEPGILDSFLNMMKKPASEMKSYQKFCIACVDEMSVKVSNNKHFYKFNFSSVSP